MEKKKNCTSNCSCSFRHCEDHFNKKKHVNIESRLSYFKFVNFKYCFFFKKLGFCGNLIHSSLNSCISSSSIYNFAAILNKFVGCLTDMGKYFVAFGLFVFGKFGILVVAGWLANESLIVSLTVCIWQIIDNWHVFLRRKVIDRRFFIFLFGWLNCLILLKLHFII